VIETEQPQENQTQGSAAAEAQGERRRRLNPKQLQAALIGLFLLLASAALLMPLLVRGMDEALARTFRHEIAWTGHHGRTELYGAMQALALVEPDADAPSLSAAKLANDIFFSRLQTWSAGQFRSFIENEKRRSEAFAMITGTMPKLERALDGIETGAGRADIMVLLQQLRPAIDMIAAQSYIEYQRNLRISGDMLRFYQRVQIFLVVGLILCSLLLMFGLTVQNRTLVASNNRQREIASHNAFLAAHDVLTGLPNRATFLLALEAACRRVTSDRGVAVMTIDLDGFKPINDLLGHKAGDFLLQSISRRLEAICASGESAFAARFGGDEFMVMAEGLVSAEAAEAFAETLREELRKPILIGDHRVSIDATIGVAIIWRENVSPDELIQQSDVALNVGKSAGKGTVRSFHPAMLEGAALRQQLEIELSESDLERDFEPFYQPVIDMATRQIVGVEALARWRHPNRGLVPPSDFIPIAESSGRIVDIGAIILRKACEDALRWPVPITVAVNLSAVQLMRMDVPILVWNTLAETGLSASRLKLEFTESVMIHDAKGTRRLMVELQDLGIMVALDDFGTGFSSLSYLRSFPFDELKIDRSFVADIESDQQCAEVVQTILSLARTLNMGVVVEGVETEKQARLLTAMGCTKGQGYYFSRPLPSAELMALLEREQAREIPKVA
jgi:diguanylate cyclase (GGDEF)-like protein